MPPLGDKALCVSDSVGRAVLAFTCAPGAGAGSAEGGVGRCVERKVFLHAGMLLSC